MIANVKVKRDGKYKTEVPFQKNRPSIYRILSESSQRFKTTVQIRNEVITVVSNDVWMYIASAHPLCTRKKALLATIETAVTALNRIDCRNDFFFFVFFLFKVGAAFLVASLQCGALLLLLATTW